MDKAKITRGQANAIESKRNRDDGQAVWSNKDFAEAYILGIGDTQKIIRQLPFDTLMMVLIVGYEVEETPEDKVREYYKKNANREAPDTYSTAHKLGTRDGILGTLSLLNIKIEGVNT